MVNLFLVIVAALAIIWRSNAFYLSTRRGLIARMNRHSNMQMMLKGIAEKMVSIGNDLTQRQTLTETNIEETLKVTIFIWLFLMD